MQNFIQKILKTDYAYLRNGGAWLASGTFISTLMSLVVLYCFANFLDPKIYGVYQYVISISAFAWAFTLTGMNAATTREIAKNNDGAFWKNFWKQMKWSTVVGIFILPVSLYYFVNGNI